MSTVRTILAALTVFVAAGAHAQQAPAAPTPAAPPPAAPPAPAACFPECRPGFLCHQGSCISACNPACPGGTECTSERTCAPIAPQPAAATPIVITQPAPAPAQPTAKEQALREAELNRERVRAFRRAHILDLVPTLDTEIRVHVVGDYNAYSPRPVIFASAWMGGVAKNLTSFFGIMGRGTLALGGASLNSEGGVGSRRDGNNALYYGLQAELVPYFGPLGSFYIGPLFTAGYHGYSRDQLTSQDGDTATLHNRFLGSVGGTAGLFLGPRRDVHIHWFIDSTLTNYLPWRMGFGVGYRFGLGSGPID